MTTTEAFIDLHASLKRLYDDREAKNITDWVLENITEKKSWQRRMDEQSLTEGQRALYEKYKIELLQSKPVQYVLNEAWFCGMKFILNENVLIPRPETEELISLIVKENTGKRDLSILDIGSGSGCIPIAIKRKLPHVRVHSYDISSEAVDTARTNARRLNVDVNFGLLDFLNENAWEQMGKYDIIVSNPPYIPAAEKSTLDKHVVDFEPGVALFVPDNDPFIFYKKIKAFAANHLNKGGKIYLEVHENYAREVLTIYKDTFPEARIVNDMYGKARMVEVKSVEQ